MEPPSKKYFSTSKLDELILTYPIRPKDMSAAEREQEMAQRACFIDLLRGLLCLNPIERLSPHQALQHAFFKQQTTKPASKPKPVVSGQPVATRSQRSNTLNSLSLREVPPPLAKVGQVNAGYAPIPPSERRDDVEMAPPVGSSVTAMESLITNGSSSSNRKPASAAKGKKPPQISVQVMGQRRASQPVLKGVEEEEEDTNTKDVHKDLPAGLWSGVPASMPVIAQKPSAQPSRRSSVSSSSRRSSAPNINTPNAVPNTPSQLKHSTAMDEHSSNSDHLMDIDTHSVTAHASSSRHGSFASSTTSSSVGSTMFYGELDDDDLGNTNGSTSSEKRSRAKRH